VQIWEGQADELDSLGFDAAHHLGGGATLLITPEAVTLDETHVHRSLSVAED